MLTHSFLASHFQLAIQRGKEIKRPVNAANKRDNQTPVSSKHV